MTKTAAVAFEVRWRKSVDPDGQWSSPVRVGADGHVKVPGLERVNDYVFEARAISGCGAKSAWATQTFNMPDAPTGTLTLADLKTEVTDAQADADAAITQLAAIASDSVLSPAEKPTVIRDYGVLTTEQAGIDGQASAYGITTEKTAYDNAVSALTTYLNGLTSPKAWNDKSGNTTIVAATFKSKFTTVYTTRQTLLNAIYAEAKQRADDAQNTANTATALASQVAVLNAGFDAGDTGWSKGTGWSIKSDGSFGHGTGYAERVGGADGALRNNAVCFVQPGHSYKVQALIKAIGANGQCYARISWRDLNDSEIGTTNGDLITGTTVAGSFAVGMPPAGAVFAHAEIAATSHTTGTYQVDNVVSTLQPATADEIAETAGKKWAGQSGADVTSDNVSYGPNVIINPGAETGSLSPHYADGGGGTWSIWKPADRNHSGSGAFRFDYAGQSGPANLYFNGQAYTDTKRQAAAREGEIWRFSGWVYDWGSGAMGSIRQAIDFRGRDGTLVSGGFFSVSVTEDLGTGAYFEVFGKAPTGTQCVNARIIVDSAGTSTALIVDDVELRKATVADAGSGVALGNQFNLPAITFAGISAMPTSNPISFSISGTTITFSVAAFTMNAGSGGTVSYSASSASRSDQSAGTTRTYYLFYIDHGAKGGSKALQATAFLSTLAASDDNVFIGSCTVTIASGGGGSSGTGGGGGGVLPPPGGGGYPIP